TTYEETTSDSSSQLRLLRSRGGRISKIPSGLSVLSNGLPYYYVEVTGDNGSQFGIPAYGDEAIRLHNEAILMEELGVMINA
ncbi:MAG: hypothetical protein WBP84_01825, partial [Nitrososphaeraceae archaeon]